MCIACKNLYVFPIIASPLCFRQWPPISSSFAILVAATFCASRPSISIAGVKGQDRGLRHRCILILNGVIHMVEDGWGNVIWTNHFSFLFFNDWGMLCNIGCYGCVHVLRTVGLLDRIRRRTIYSEGQSGFCERFAASVCKYNDFFTRGWLSTAMLALSDLLIV